MSDPPLPAALEVLATGPFSEEQVHVCWEPRLPVSAAAAVHTDDRWNHYLRAAQAAGKTLFDGPVTLLAGFAVDSTGLTVRVTPGFYKEFLVTTLRDHAWYAAHAPAACAPALGNSVLLTFGDAAVLGVRSAHVSAYAGYAHLFGGVLDATPNDGGGSAILLRHLLQELREEAGLGPEELIGRPRLLALARDPALRQPELIWHWELAVPPQVLAGRLDRREHDHLLILPRDAARHVPLTPVAQAALHMSASIRNNV